MTGYYDYVLGLIPVALLGITGVLSMSGVAMAFAVPLGASVSVALIGHALFVNGPAATEPEPVKTTGATKTTNANVTVNAD